LKESAGILITSQVRVGESRKIQERLRKRYRCVEVSTKRVYLFSPVAEVELIQV
jgi:hypothetical protein